ncbi:MAG: 2-hydroxychromene-2-carboxylate isomerase [Myxococcales bacterium]|nr:2-hydroxychromene-2-carboxylate isomerase [Myxococcales bacterium]
MELRFFYDVVCPYAYLASTRVEAMAARTGASVRWIPILLGGLFREVDAPTNPSALMNPAKARHNLLDMRRWADLWSVPLSMPAAHPRRTVAAMRLCVAADDATRPALSQALFRAYWADGEDVADRAVLDRIARAHGLDPAVIDGDAAREGLFASTREAARAGAFGVPAFVVGEHLFWGQDRMHLVEAALGGPVRSQLDGAPLRRDRSDRPRVRFFHDYASPFSYLAATQIDALAAARGLEVAWTPILLGALFRSIGTPDVPLFTMSENKRRYVARDLDDWARALGVPYQFPSRFPLRSVLPLRVTLVEPAAASHLYRAYWAEDQAIDDPETLAAVLTAAGFDAATLLERSQAPAIKAALRQNTEEAEAAAVFGVPTVEVSYPGAAPLLFWGQDRLTLAAAAMDGWIPAGEGAPDPSGVV